MPNNDLTNFDNATRWQSLLDSRAQRRDGLPSVLHRYPHLQPSLEDEISFQRVFPRYNIDNAPDDIQDCLFDLRWRGKLLFDTLFDPNQGDLPFEGDRVIFDFIDRYDISAHVYPPEELSGVYHIGFSVGLVAQLYRVGYALLSLPDVFPESGNSSKESASDAEVAACLFAPTNQDLRFASHQLSLLPSAAFADLCPKDIDRQYMAHAMVGVGLQWFYYHEFHHVWAGHLRFAKLQRNNSKKFLGFFETEDEVEESLGASELTVKTHNIKDPWLRRLIEYDADKRAARRMIDALINDRVMLNAVNLNESEKKHLFGCWALMLGYLFILLNPRPTNDVKASDRLYPHPEVRFWGVFAAFEDQLSPDQVDLYQNAIRTTHQLLRRLWKAAGRKGDCYSNSRLHIDEVIGEANRLSAAVNQELYPILLPYDTDQLLARRNYPSDETRVQDI
jgi:hypothetical protein